MAAVVWEKNKKWLVVAVLLKVRRLLRAGLADAHGGGDGELAGSEDSADEDADVVMTGT